MAIISKVATWSSAATLWAVQKNRNELGVLILAHAVRLKKHETNLVKHMSADLRYMQGVCVRANSVYQSQLYPWSIPNVVSQRRHLWVQGVKVSERIPRTKF